MADRGARDLPVVSYVTILLAIVMILASQFGDPSRIEFLLALVLWTALALQRASAQRRAGVLVWRRIASMAPPNQDLRIQTPRAPAGDRPRPQ